jgi:hypothetical protein
MYHAGIPGWRPSFSVTAAGSGSTNRSSRSTRHRSPGLPERHRACRASERARYVGGMVGGHTGLPTRCRRVARTRRASATQARRDPRRVAVHEPAAGALRRALAPSSDAFQTWWSPTGDRSRHEPGSPPRFPGVRRRLIDLHRTVSAPRRRERPRARTRPAPRILFSHGTLTIDTLRHCPVAGVRAYRRLAHGRRWALSSLAPEAPRLSAPRARRPSALP